MAVISTQVHLPLGDYWRVRFASGRAVGAPTSHCPSRQITQVLAPASHLALYINPHLSSRFTRLGSVWIAPPVPPVLFSLACSPSFPPVSGPDILQRGLLSLSATLLSPPCKIEFPGHCNWCTNGMLRLSLMLSWSLLPQHHDRSHVGRPDRTSRLLIPLLRCQLDGKRLSSPSFASCHVVSLGLAVCVSRAARSFGPSPFPSATPCSGDPMLLPFNAICTHFHDPVPILQLRYHLASTSYADGSTPFICLLIEYTHMGWTKSAPIARTHS
ncbi:uncharacterized protein BJ171DRAFT_204191 [Polychytrium aggregatum]|uniref:uncharacterized protein n=1 Tax=Polychytrium aggregatum TaxID=110093 RepID=UPI0022FE88D9|nr:uncharacterized protein BJ171DRAFT_204191 [Polychytrium aggregatum]KAI9199561.1 hypothetical protein BJ171DRAFT_204191 [Polychytrium aggregatum]